MLLLKMSISRDPLWVVGRDLLFDGRSRDMRVKHVSLQLSSRDYRNHAETVSFLEVKSTRW